jgi:hypothetical protein
MIGFDSSTDVTFWDILCYFSLYSCPPEILLQWYILLVLVWIEYCEQWASPMILRRSSKSFGTTRQSLNHRTPSASCRKHWASPNSILWWRWLIPTSVLWAAMMSSLIVGMRAILFNLPCGTTQRLGSSGSQHEEWNWTVIWLYWCLRLRASATIFALSGW